MKLINNIQAKIESLYGIKLGEQAQDYLIETDELMSLIQVNQNTSIPKELFLVNPNPKDDTLEVALFFDPELKKNLDANNPMESLSQKNISDFCALIEGISHFVYYIHKASLSYNVTQLELELQAEIDKFLLLALLVEGQPVSYEVWLDMLFADYYLNANLSAEQSERYVAATMLARKYCFNLAQNIKTRDLKKLFAEIRKFYPLNQEEKIRVIMN